MEVLPLVDCNMSSLGGDFPNGSHHYLKPRETLQQESPKNQSFLTLLTRSLVPISSISFFRRFVQTSTSRLSHFQPIWKGCAHDAHVMLQSIGLGLFSALLVMQPRTMDTGAVASSYAKAMKPWPWSLSSLLQSHCRFSLGALLTNSKQKHFKLQWKSW